MLTNSTSRKSVQKAKKPHKDFPLHVHATGRWAKKVRGKRIYFGKVSDDPKGEAAIEKWLAQKDDLLAGRTPRVKGNAFCVGDLCNHFLTFKISMRDSGELAVRSFDRYYKTCEFLVEQLGRDRPIDDLIADDFITLRGKMAKRWGPVALGNEIQIIRSVFRYGYDADLLATPVRFGPGFKKPSARVLRRSHTLEGPKLFAPGQIRELLKVASVNLKAMIFLGINGGLGNGDLGAVPTKAFDLKGAWLNYPRPKTGVARRVPLWSETIKSIQAVIKNRRQPTNCEDIGLLFVSENGNYYGASYTPWRLSGEFSRAAKEAKVIGRTFYDLRRTFQTIAEGAGDLVAVQSIMGHAPASDDMSSMYRQRISDERLRATAEHVRTWLFESKTKRQAPAKKVESR